MRNQQKSNKDQKKSKPGIKKNQNKDQKNKILWKWRKLKGLGLAGSRPRIKKKPNHGKLRKPANAAICSVGSLSRTPNAASCSIRSLSKAPKICHLQSWQFFQNSECCNLQCSWPFKSRTFCSLQYWLPFKNSKRGNLHHFYNNKIKKHFKNKKRLRKIGFHSDMMWNCEQWQAWIALQNSGGSGGGRSLDVQR